MELWSSFCFGASVSDSSKSVKDTGFYRMNYGTRHVNKKMNAALIADMLIFAEQF